MTFRFERLAAARGEKAASVVYELLVLVRNQFPGTAAFDVVVKGHDLEGVEPRPRQLTLTIWRSPLTGACGALSVSAVGY